MMVLYGRHFYQKCMEKKVVKIFKEIKEIFDPKIFLIPGKSTNRRWSWKRNI